MSEWQEVKISLKDASTGHVTVVDTQRLVERLNLYCFGYRLQSL